ncbi:hypothetical protein BF17_00720 [Yersinia similis]|uniref:Uncharacterized protein n=1 Tax=Yersinia similis TaxID=367190 RepID=A0ABM5Q3E4_9GAMM|nr:hypothetical protein BF17_00720 [Yersinia similis]
MKSEQLKALRYPEPIVCVKTSAKAYLQEGETVYTVWQNPNGCSIIPFVLEAAAMFAVSLFGLFMGLTEAAASCVQICSRQICHPNH